jgi:VanZ family protein
MRAILPHGLRWLAVVLWMGAIFVLSNVPSLAPLAPPLEPSGDFMAKKLAHMAEYAILTALLFHAVRPHVKRAPHALLISALVGILYAFSDEWHQTFVAGRHGSLRDVGLDALGIAGISAWLRGISSPGRA